MDRNDVVLVTGGNSGIGLETCVALARTGARVVFTARDAKRGDLACREIRSRSQNDAVEVMALDLARFASVREFASELLDRYDRLDVLIHNAGVLLGSRRETEDGNETTLQVNHLGPFLLTALLRDRLAASGSARVVVVSSDAHTLPRHGLNFDDLQSTRGYHGFSVYGRSKLANILFARELARRLDGTDVTANALHPGVVATRFARDGDTALFGILASPMLRLFALNPEQGAQTSIYVASAPELHGITGGYWVKCAPTAPSVAAQDDAAARRLWEASEQLVGIA